MVSSACAGLAGALLALSSGVVNTGEFPLSLSIYHPGRDGARGDRHPHGRVVGGDPGRLPAQPVVASRLASDFNLSHLVSANLAVIIFGVVLVVVMLVAPTGIQGGLRWLGRKLVTALDKNPTRR